MGRQGQRKDDDRARLMRSAERDRDRMQQRQDAETDLREDG